MRNAGRHKEPSRGDGSDQELKVALKGLRRILNLIELDENVVHEEEGGVDALVYARQMIAERYRRYHYFDGQLFSDPAWDIMLELFVAGLEEREVAVTNLCVSSNVPDTTVLRWIRTLSQEGIVTRRKDKVDKRRVLVELTRPAAVAMARYVDEQIRAADRVRAAAHMGDEPEARGDVRHLAWGETPPG